MRILSTHPVFIVILLLVIGIPLFQAPVAAQQRLLKIMPPLASGSLYPEDPETLFEVLKRNLEEADTPLREERLVATIVPHDGLGLSGDVAAHAFKHLRQGEYERVMILGAPHFSTFEGCSIPAVYGFETPLGIVPVDTHAVEQLTRSPLIAARSVRSNSQSNRSNLHEIEYTIEMVLPFLQMTIHDFSIIPIMVGDLRDASRNYNENIIEAAAEGIARELDDRTLLVVSTDFTHFGNDFSYRPFNSHILDRIFTMDHDIIDRVMRLDTNGLQEIVEASGVPICGLSALQVLTKLLPHNVRGELLAYDTSGRKTGQYERSSISYAAINFYASPDHADAPASREPVVMRMNPDEEVVEGRAPRRRESIRLTLPPGSQYNRRDADSSPDQAPSDAEASQDTVANEEENSDEN